jgi:predicted nucleic acid-binding protein
VRLLFDTNVVLDVLLEREPFAAPAAALLSEVESGRLTGFVCATTVTTIHYLATKVIGRVRARKEIRKLLSIVEVAGVNRGVLEEALESEVPDFEDAVLCATARQASAQAVVTRDPRDFKGSVLPVYSPQEALAQLRAGDDEGA